MEIVTYSIRYPLKLGHFESHNNIVAQKLLWIIDESLRDFHNTIIVPKTFKRFRTLVPHNIRSFQIAQCFDETWF